MFEMHGNKTVADFIKSRAKLRPVTLPRFSQAWTVAWENSWSPSKAGVSEDVNDWLFNLTANEKRIVARVISGGFVAVEAIVGDHWIKISNDISLPIEVTMLARLFSAQECNHALGYDMLSSTLDIDTLDLENEFQAYSKLYYAKTQHYSDLVVSTAIFAGALECVSLMSSFALLESFSTTGRLNAMKRIMSWSRNDELLHGAMGIELFHYLVQEGGLTDPQVDSIYEGFDNVVNNEILFIDWCFEDNQLDWISKSDLHDLTFSLANKSLHNLGLTERYVTKNENELLDYFNAIQCTGTYVDFFRGHNGENYTVSNHQRLENEILETCFLSEL